MSTFSNGIIRYGPPSGTRILDGRGAILHPGFVDAHLHFGLGGDAMSQLDLSTVSSREAFRSRDRGAPCATARGQVASSERME